MPALPDWVLRRETFAALVVAALAAAIGVALYLSQATTLTIAVAPRDGTEPALIKAYADALETGRENIRLKILSFEDVRESAAALQDGRADLAVVRPDVLLPKNGLTLAILRDQAMLIVSPEGSGITSFPKLSGKRLGIAAHRSADFWLLKNILAYYNLTLENPEAAPAAVPVPGNTVRLVAIDGSDAAAAIRDKRIDAFVSIIAASAPKARALVEAVRGVGRAGKLDFVDVADSDAVIERFPRLQAVTVPAGLFGGRPKLPADDVKTVGASYRLMARTSLSRAVAADVTQHLFELRTAAAEETDAAEYVQAPAYETTVAATSARIPIHPGAIDYFEREQHGFVERYGDTLYLLAALGGGLASAVAWLRQRLASLRRERIDEVTDRLLEITDQARSLRDPETIAGLAVEIDRLAIEVVRDMRRRELDTRTMTAVSIAIETARATVADCRIVADGTGAPAAPPVA
ncbi:TAXI family TRAP transporter solute-binding subunit [Methylobacterium platani]|uniref:C4-dicarboxylate ABC transporter substrate-binding protein n=2 Tax=Methylobacterium platani TaxID=427683 RepID=A0A179SFK7_9HYPH|nr:TAXI family TRAP transporter solute-binding subunit [Methylobacterium platani]KMO11123.1 C4-dicarboxylate ABC transporter substrate-binding protein [Methylobacterium platani JCM 14648]OAS25734.1 C4-dicarboxylate ABC transporter substrate-binding protein [Methylobacterium platani]